jgi:CheY-like chemotaxis protein
VLPDQVLSVVHNLAIKSATFLCNKVSSVLLVRWRTDRLQIAWENLVRVHASTVWGECSVVRILVADDNAAIRRCLRGLLDHHSDWLVCDEASNGKEAVETFQRARPDLIVLDFQMPEMNGLEAARFIVNASPKTPILMVTIHLSKQLSDEARKVGIRGACAKTNIHAVVDAVDALLREETYFPN